MLRLFAAAREAAGTDRADIRAPTVEAVLAEAVERFGETFASVLAGSRIWLNGEPVDPGHAVREGDEVAVLPPVSGGQA